MILLIGLSFIEKILCQVLDQGLKKLETHTVALFHAFSLFVFVALPQDLTLCSSSLFSSRMYAQRQTDPCIHMCVPTHICVCTHMLVYLIGLRACSICGVGQMLKQVVGFAFTWKIEEWALTIMTTSYSSGTMNSLQLPQLKVCQGDLKLCSVKDGTCGCLFFRLQFFQRLPVSVTSMVSRKLHARTPSLLFSTKPQIVFAFLSSPLSGKRSQVSFDYLVVLC